MMMNAVLLTCLGFSLIGNIAQLVRARKSIKNRPQSIELQEFLGDLLAGPAMLAIARVDQDNLLIRSPRGRR